MSPAPDEVRQRLGLPELDAKPGMIDVREKPPGAATYVGILAACLIVITVVTCLCIVMVVETWKAVT